MVVHFSLFLYKVCNANRFVLYDLCGFCQEFWRHNRECDTNSREFANEKFIDKNV
ncbi:hypothetical protein Pelsub_P0275 [Pelolinea submarina]|nr:hypothetical protein Pelsub_P0275 [Pelolinea submarina]